MMRIERNTTTMILTQSGRSERGLKSWSSMSGAYRRESVPGCVGSVP